jgi:hypothetical protein
MKAVQIRTATMGEILEAKKREAALILADELTEISVALEKAECIMQLVVENFFYNKDITKDIRGRRLDLSEFRRNAALASAAFDNIISASRQVSTTEPYKEA